MKATLWNSAALVTFALIAPATADIIYSNLLDTPIPTGTWSGVTVTVNGGQINPFFGGVGVANDSVFQPARDGTDQLDTILNLPVGTTISISNGALYFSTGAGGSEDHLGTNFTAGTQGYIGFNSGGNYGWMRVVFTYDTAGALIKDWAYDNGGSGGSIVVGRVLENVVDGSNNRVTLSPDTGESFTLASALGNASLKTNSVLKTGAGTTTLSATNTYSGTTSILGGTLVINGNQSAATGVVTVGGNGSSGTPTLSGTGTIGGATTIAVAGSGVAGTHAPGDPDVDGGVGTQTFSSTITYATGSVFEWDLTAGPEDPGADTANSGTYDKVVAASLAGSGATFSISSADAFATAFWDTNKTWSDIFSTGSLATVFSSITGTGIVWDAGQGNVANQGYFTMGGSTLSWTAVPEPTSALAGLLLAAGLLRRRR